MKIKAKFKKPDNFGYKKGSNYWLDFTININDKIVVNALYCDHLDCKTMVVDDVKMFLSVWQVF